MRASNLGLLHMLLMFIFLQDVANTANTPPNKEKKKKTKSAQFLEPLEPTNLDISIESDDPETDPDWRNTPLAKRIYKEKELSRISSKFY